MEEKKKNYSKGTGTAKEEPRQKYKKKKRRGNS